MNSASFLTRSAVGALLALLMALRLLTPAGFMPAFDHGSVTIVACPDYGPSPSQMAHHHHGGTRDQHQPCPYAAAGVAATTAEDLALSTAIPLFGTEGLFGRPFRFLERHRAHDRPPLRGPPLFA